LSKIQNIQALRGIAAMLVVISHVVIIEKRFGGSETILPDFLLFGLFGVDLFFVISGFIMVTITRHKFRIPREAFKFLYRRVARIYPTYWFYTIVVLIVFLFQPSWVNQTHGGKVDILSSFLLFPSYVPPIVGVAWTLIHEMYFYLTFFIVLLLVSEKHLTYTLFLWGIGVALMNIYMELGSPVARIVSHPLTIEFIGGCLLAIVFYRKNIKINNGNLLLLVAVSLLASFFGYIYYQNTTGLVEPEGWWRIIIWGIPAFLIVLGAANAEKCGLVVHGYLIKGGDASYSIYLSHVLTLSAVGRVWSIFATDSVVDNVFMIPVLIVAVLCIGSISYLVIEKPMLKVSHRIA
jgi:peptidoglycan/LPS O-acetylase OafA/YrhL